ncbi:MAG: PAS-domain containing protein, partial [Hyphomicrobiaceae bacterium]|nr:PAS-domain containing protein [Hyphomicrobiaceae bacterium]
VHFEDLVRLDIEKGTVKSLGDGKEDHLRARFAKIDSAKGSFDLELSDGRWANIRDRRTAAGGYVSTHTDITERKRAEQTSRESQQLLATILNNMPAMVYLRDAEGRFKLVNRKYEEVHDVDNEKIRGKTLHEVFPKRRADEFARLDVEVLKHHRVQEGEERHWLGEEERTHAVMKFPILDTAGDIVGVGGIDIDITNRKRTEKALTEKETQLRIALDNMPGGIIHVDRDLNYVLFNAQYSQLCDFPDGLLEVGGSIRDHLRYQAERGDFGPGDKDELIEEVLAVYHRGKAASWERTIADSGRTIEVHVAPTPEGGYVSILTDITDTVESQRGAKLLQEAIDIFSDMLILYDKNERVVFTNDRYHEIYPNSPP